MNASAEGAEHSLFYFPYASLADPQAPLLKLAALWFDALYMLDPRKASLETIGAPAATHEIELLSRPLSGEAEPILRPLAPEEILVDEAAHSAIAGAVREDLTDPAFVERCSKSPKTAWTLALEKVPAGLRDDPKFAPLDNSMRRFMAETAADAADLEDPEYREVELDEDDAPDIYDEYRETAEGVREYRYADYPVALGESLMVNHALIGGLQQRGAVPVTDDPFHHDILALKLDRAHQRPEFAALLADRRKKRSLKEDRMAALALSDKLIALPALSPKVPLDSIVEWRRDHADELGAARRELALLALEIQESPWSADFEEAVERRLRSLRECLKEAEQARTGWLKSKRGKLALQGTGLTVGTAAAVASVTLGVAPLVPVVFALGLVADTVVPGLDLLREWRKERQSATENGLHYLVGLRPS